MINMWEYKTVLLSTKDLTEWNSASSLIVRDLKRKFKKRFEMASGKEQEAIFENEYFPAIKQRIKESIPILEDREIPIIKENQWESRTRESLRYEEYLEVILNHYAQEGWELDRSRPIQAGNFQDSILIFRRKAS